ncbi:tetraspanin-19-like isoform X2 [Malania oleifera]|uniref:tetraspanin-19-like isoform X2 n=1 Tax=Malania oleifera TaxID=397392 RepID=UPI0025ADA2CD|nr:tetraspanin-19-like isoform X2 [Malania oleifera]
MENFARSCLQFLLKILNSIMGISGIAMILYGLWMVRVWQRDMGGSPSGEFNSSAPWFIYSFLGTGIALCLITCSGHVAAASANSHCLSCYTVIIFVVLLLETAMIADIFLNSDWEKQDLPDDPTGRFNDFKDFVKSNFDIFQWIGFLIILAQGLCVLLAMVLKTLGPNMRADYDSDADYASARLPLLNHPAQQLPYVIGDPNFASKNDSWNEKNYEKATK